MNGYQVTEQNFLNDVANSKYQPPHEMTVVKDSGIDRHIRFRSPTTSNCHFDLITWHNHLCITGDCGTYVFSRCEDMFQFFRHYDETTGELKINPRYWSEKLLSADMAGGVREYSDDILHDVVLEMFKEYRAETGDDIATQRETFQDLKREIFVSHDNEYCARLAVEEFKSVGGFEFYDFWERQLTTYTVRYIWNCYAIVWGIRQYDGHRDKQKKAA